VNNIDVTTKILWEMITPSASAKATKMSMSINLNVATIDASAKETLDERPQWHRAYFALANVGKRLGHLGHMKWPFGRSMERVDWITDSSMGCGDCVKEQAWLETDLSIELKVIEFDDEDGIEVLFPLSSSSEGLEGSEKYWFAERGEYRTEPPSESFWLASEIDSVRSH